MSIEQPVDGPPESVTPTNDSITAKITGHSSESAENLTATVSTDKPNEVSQESIVTPGDTTVCISTEIHENEQRQEQTIPDENSGIDQKADLYTESIEGGSTSPSDIQTSVSTAGEPKSLSVEESCQEMMEKIAAYLRGELAGTCEDYKLLETLNKLSINKYTDMSNTTKNLIECMTVINEKYKALGPYISQIDDLEDSVVKLEQAAYKLDAYSKQLENKFKKLERR